MPTVRIRHAANALVAPHCHNSGMGKGVLHGVADGHSNCSRHLVNAMADGWMLKHLTAATSLYQSAVDDTLIAAASSPDAYRCFLARAFGWERGVEVALAHVHGFEWDLTGRAKSTSVAEDLFAMGMSAEELFALPSCMDAVDAITDVPSALGWLFVSERVSFAHGMAYHQLSGSVRKLATAYFDALLMRATWSELSKSIDRLASDQRATEQLMTSATLAFRSKRGWLASTAKKTGRIVAFPKIDPVVAHQVADEGNEA